LGGGHPVKAALWILALDDAIKSGTLVVKKDGRRTTVEFGGLLGEDSIELADFRRITASASQTMHAVSRQPSADTRLAGSSQVKPGLVPILMAWRTLSAAMDYVNGTADDHAQRQHGSGLRMTLSPRAGVTWYALQEAVVVLREAIATTRQALPQAKQIKEGLLPGHMRWKNIAAGLLARIDGLLMTDIPARAGQPRIIAGRLMKIHFNQAALAELKHKADELGVALENDLPVPRPKAQRSPGKPDGFRKLRWVVSAINAASGKEVFTMLQLKHRANKLPDGMFRRICPEGNRHVNVRELVNQQHFLPYREILLDALAMNKVFPERQRSRRKPAKQRIR